jgi:hypothetical protein
MDDLIIYRYCVQGVQRLLPERVIEEDVRALRACMVVDGMMYKLEMIMNVVCGEDALSVTNEEEEQQQQQEKDKTDQVEWNHQVFSCHVCY